MTPRAVAAREEELSDWLMDHDVDQDWLIAPALAAAGLDVDWCEQVAAVLDGDALGTGLEWIAHAVIDVHPAVRGEGIDRPDLRPGRRGEVVFADGPGVAAEHRRPGGAGEHPDDAGAQARGGITVDRDYAPTSRGSRRWPAS